jgi:hypothetical protein
MDFFPRGYTSSPREHSLSQHADVEKEDFIVPKGDRSDHNYNFYCNQHILRYICMICFLVMLIFVISYSVKGHSTKSMPQSLELGKTISSGVDEVSKVEPKKMVLNLPPQNRTMILPTIAWCKYDLPVAQIRVMKTNLSPHKYCNSTVIPKLWNHLHHGIGRLCE